MTDTIVCYHFPCLDGFSAAWAAWKYFKDDATYLPVNYGDQPPDVNGKHVVLADFSFKRPVIEQIGRTAKSILVLDHHKSAQEDLEGLPINYGTWEEHVMAAERGKKINVWFDPSMSGAGLAWRFFHPGKSLPLLLYHVQDRDLWRFAHSDTDAINACLGSHPYTFEAWSDLARYCDDPGLKPNLMVQGNAILRWRRKILNELLPQVTRDMKIAGHLVPTANLPYVWASEGAGQLAELKSVPFAATYYDALNERRFSLRSRKGHGLDVSVIARQYGGGGHFHAAGFSVPIGWEGEPIW